MGFMSIIGNMTKPGEWLDGDALRDLGLTRYELNALKNARPEVRDQYEAMGRLFGLRPDDIAADRWQQLDVTMACTQCKKSTACAKFLAGKGEFLVDSFPNAQTYADLAEAKYAAG